ncbi:hypothetical protein J8L70_00295 [Pseudoalteromonas sp. MMG010]|uniref:zinc ribbon-containing protein n=1 Tax=Pseudoalteromonas sp. MMG010 TaxID=2822685 RepID=UPI001B39D309|nr:hypothetical protein [Pseudoalteromonas sp. MMG010]MBQ4831676.1 hypothetical protein [Pseudoalteromonas sp. MMG010]
MTDYKTWLNTLTDWLKDVNEHEVKGAVTRFIDSEQALKNIGSEKLNLYRSYLERDLAHFTAHQSHYNSLAWEELKETFWYEIAHIEDKTQLEWHAINEDLKHNGDYLTGEWIAMGTLVCKNCTHSYDVFHTAQIRSCPKCDGIYFSRKALHP